MARDETGALGQDAVREPETAGAGDDTAGTGDDTAEDPATGGPRVDVDWARRQRRLAVSGAVLALIAFGCTVVGLIGYPPEYPAPTWRIYLATGTAALLAMCCVVLVLGWQRGVRAWQSAERVDLGGWIRWCFVAHLLSYPAVLAVMYGAVAESSLVGWSTATGTQLGIAFVLGIAAQTMGGSQYLRRDGPPGTVPNYLRKLNTKVQSLR